MSNKKQIWPPQPGSLTVGELMTALRTLQDHGGTVNDPVRIRGEEREVWEVDGIHYDNGTLCLDILGKPEHPEDGSNDPPPPQHGAERGWYQVRARYNLGVQLDIVCTTGKMDSAYDEAAKYPYWELWYKAADPSCGLELMESSPILNKPVQRGWAVLAATDATLGTGLEHVNTHWDPEEARREAKKHDFSRIYLVDNPDRPMLWMVDDRELVNELVQREISFLPDEFGWLVVAAPDTQNPMRRVGIYPTLGDARVAAGKHTFSHVWQLNKGGETHLWDTAEPGGASRE